MTAAPTTGDPIPAVLIVGDAMTTLLAGALSSTGYEANLAADAAHARLTLEWFAADVVVVDLRGEFLSGEPGGSLDIVAEIEDARPGAAVIGLVRAGDAVQVAREIGPRHGLVVDSGSSLGPDVLVALDTALRIRRTVARVLPLFGDVRDLPRRPEIHAEIIELTADPRSTSEDIAAAVESDLAAVTEILRLVNSAYFGMRTRVESVVQAVRLLGVEVIGALSVASTVFRESARAPQGLDLAAVAERAMLTATTARRIAQTEGWSADARSDLFVAALLHDVGLLALATALPGRWAAWRVATAAGPPPAAQRDAAETDVFGCAVAEAAAAVLQHWGFNDGVVGLLAALAAGTAAGAGAAPWRPPAAAALLAARWAGAGPAAGPRPMDPWLDDDRCRRWLTEIDDNPAVVPNQRDAASEDSAPEAAESLRRSASAPSLPIKLG